MIIVYGRPNCVRCLLTTRHLDKLKLAYKYIDIDADKAAARDVKAMGFATLPVVVVSNDEKWAGFRYEKLLGLKETEDY